MLSNLFTLSLCRSKQPDSVSTAISSLAASASGGPGASTVSEDEKRKILEEESRQLQMLKVGGEPRSGVGKPPAYYALCRPSPFGGSQIKSLYLYKYKYLVSPQSLSSRNNSL